MQVQAIGLIILLGLLAGAFKLQRAQLPPVRVPDNVLQEQKRAQPRSEDSESSVVATMLRALDRLIGVAHWIILLVMVLEAAETMIVLRKFARKETEIRLVSSE